MTKKIYIAVRIRIEDFSENNFIADQYKFGQSPAAPIIIKLLKLRWTESATRMDNARIPKGTLKGKIQER